MKNIIYTVLGVLLLSCNKQELTKNTDIHELSQDQIEVNFVVSNKTDGILAIYRYNDVEPDTIISISDLHYSEVFMDKSIHYGISIPLYYSREQIKDCDGRFFVTVHFSDSVPFIMNMNYFNSNMTFSGNLNYLEPSTKVTHNTNYFENSFWVKYKVESIEYQSNYPTQ